MFFNINNKNTILTLKEKESETNFSLMESFENSSIRSQYPIDASYYNGKTNCLISEYNLNNLYQMNFKTKS